MNNISTSTAQLSSYNADSLRNGTEQQRLKKAAKEFEAIFIQELLKNTKSQLTRGIFGGGMGEEFFQDHLNQERARAMVENGGFGLATMLEAELLQQLNSANKNELKSENSASDKANRAELQRRALQAYEPEPQH